MVCVCVLLVLLMVFFQCFFFLFVGFLFSALLVCLLALCFIKREKEGLELNRRPGGKKLKKTEEGIT